MFKKTIFILFLLCAFSFLQCKSTASALQVEALQEAVMKKNLRITANNATPMFIGNIAGIERLMPPGSNRTNINLVSTPNYIKIQKDSLDIDLPYFGEQRIVAAYNENNGIIFKGKPSKSNYSFVARKKEYEIKFSFQNRNEDFQLRMTLFPNHKTRFTINSSNRTTISYYGSWETLENK